MGLCKELTAERVRFLTERFGAERCRQKLVRVGGEEHRGGGRKKSCGGADVRGGRKKGSSFIYTVSHSVCAFQKTNENGGNNQ